MFVTAMHPTPAHPARGIIVTRLAAALRWLGVEVTEHGIGGFGGWRRYLRARRRLSHVLRAGAFDLVHVHFGYGTAALPHTHLPIITSFYGDDLHGTWSRAGGATWKSRLGILVSQIAALRSRVSIVVSAGMRERIWSPRARTRCMVLRDAVDGTLFGPLSQDTARRKLGLPRARPLILFPHDVSQPTKRLWLAQRSVERLRIHVPAAELWVVNGVPPDDMPWYYAAANTLVVTSVLEGGPSCVKEALACGLPVVSVPVGDTELFEEVPEGAFLVPATEEAIAHGLERAIVFGAQPRRALLPRSMTLAVAARSLVEVYATIVRGEDRSPEEQSRGAVNVETYGEGDLSDRRP